MVKLPTIHIVHGDWGIVCLSFTHITFYLVGGFNPSEKYDRQLGLLFLTERNNKINVPNHQPDCESGKLWISIREKSGVMGNRCGF